LSQALDTQYRTHDRELLAHQLTKDN